MCFKTLNTSIFASLNTKLINDERKKLKNESNSRKFNCYIKYAISSHIE